MDRVKTIPRKWLIIGGAAAVLLIIAAVRAGGGDSLQYYTANVERGEIRDAVDATGSVNAVITVQVGSQVSGTISRLFADFNSKVHKGDVVAEIEPSLLKGTLLQATADLQGAQANVEAAKANLEKAIASKVQAKGVYDRMNDLMAQKLEAEQNLEAAKATYDVAVAGVHAAEAAVTQAEAQAAQKEAAVAVARTNLAYTTIRSPIDGVVVARNVDVGQTVAASLQAPTIFTIAQDLTKMRVYAKVDESDVGRIKLAEGVTFKVDAFPADSFRGTVSQVRMNATTVQNVVTYDAIIEFANPDLKLFPGMTAYVTIPVATVQEAVKVPNAALRYKPPISPDEIRALYAANGIDAGGGIAGGDTANKTVMRSARDKETVVWILRPDRSLQPVKIALGITDHAFTEVKSVINGHLAPGDRVITASLVSKTLSPTGQVIRR
jgi:HlyD family secretion protein